MATNAVSQRNSRLNPSTLGSLWIVYGILRLVAVVLLILFTGTATVMFGALLNRVPDPYTLMTTFHILYIAAIIVSALSGLCGLFAGLNLLAGKSTRTLPLVAAFLSVADLPLGTTLGIYTLILYLP
jgi:hypothetical protein